MTVYFSASREHRDNLRRRQAVTERLRHHGLDRIAAELAQPAGANPPAYLETARRFGYLGGGPS